MELRQLKYLVKAVESGSLGKAAAELGLATSALSQQISKLESELSTRLLVRGSFGVKPTEAGAAFCRHATLALRHIDTAIVSAQEARLTGVVSLGLAPTTASVLALPLIKALARKYPNIQLQLVEGMSGHLVGMLKRRQIDLAILFNDESVAFIHGDALPLLDESLFLIGQGLEGKTFDVPTITEAGIRLADIALLPLILPSRSHGLRVSLNKSFAAANVLPNVIMEIDSLAVIMEAVGSGIGYTIQPGAAIARSGIGSLEVRPIIDQNAHRKNLLANLPEHELSPTALALKVLIRKVVRNLVNSGHWLGATLHDL